MDSDPFKQASMQPRAAARKMIRGRARISIEEGPAIFGKLVDISQFGICILFENIIASQKMCVIDAELMQGGKRITFTVHAISIYSILVSDQGFRVGFNFGPLDSTTEKIIHDLMT